MGSLVVEYGAKLSLIASPYLLRWLGITGPVNGADLEAAISTFLLCVVFAFEARSAAKDRSARDNFREEYVDDLVQPFQAQLGRDLRFNVMYASRWPFLLVKVFHWKGSRGFRAGVHQDARLWFTVHQGVCGLAYRNQSCEWVDLRTAPPFEPQLWPWKNPFGLSRGQFEKTRHVKAVLSVPMIKTLGPRTNPKYTRAGVINLDAVSDAGADYLAANHLEIENELLRAGAILGSLA